MDAADVGAAAASHTHAPSDVTGTAVITSDARLSDASDQKAHAHAPSEITGTAVVTNDARLSDTRTPTTGVDASLGALIVNDAGLATSNLRVESDTEENMVLVDSATDTLWLGGTTNGISIAKGWQIQGQRHSNVVR